MLQCNVNTFLCVAPKNLFVFGRRLAAQYGLRHGFPEFHVVFSHFLQYANG